MGVRRRRRKRMGSSKSNRKCRRMDRSRSRISSNKKESISRGT